MSLAPRLQLLLLLISMFPRGSHSRYLEAEDDPSNGIYSLLSLEKKRETVDFVFRRPLRCVDMLATEGQFRFSASQPMMACATFLVSAPNEVISLELSDVNIDCTAGDFIKVFDGWILKGEKFPSNQDHPLPLHQRYSDYCASQPPGGDIVSSQNVAMVFFRILGPESGFTLTYRKINNPHPCNVISQDPEGSYTMVLSHQNRNCSFSIIYPVEIQLLEMSLGHDRTNLNIERKQWSGCSTAGDYVELLGGNGVDTSKMVPVADLCFSLSGLARMKIGCDNSVVRLVSSGRYVNRVSFQYRLLERHELPDRHDNSVDDYCSIE